MPREEPELVRGDPALAIDERTSLLAPPSSTQHPQQPKTDATNGHAALEAQSEADGIEDGSKDKPLPLGQIFLLCYARLVEPVAFFSIFPFVNKMIWELGRADGLSKGDVGFWSGIIESLFSLTQMVLMIPWGRAADRFGRKPVLVAAMSGVTAGTAIFGLSRTIWQMVLFRCLSGVFAGTTMTIRVMITEHTTQKNQARAFSYFAFAGNLGIFLGPLIGGALANPSEEYPSIFGGVKFFEGFPYALSTFMTGALGAVSVVISVLFIKETLVTDESSSDEPMSMLELIRSPGVGKVLFLYGSTMLLAFAYTAILPVFYFEPPHLGGFGLSPLEITLFMSVGGLSQSIWLLLVFPPLQKKIGTAAILRGCGHAWMPFFLLYPLTNWMLRQGWKTAFWIVAMPAVVLGSGVSMAFSESYHCFRSIRAQLVKISFRPSSDSFLPHTAAVQLALNDVVPSANTLGTLNAIALTMVCGIRSVAPALFNGIYAFGVNHRILGGHLAWVILMVLATGYAAATWRLPAGTDEKPDVEREGGGEAVVGAEAHEANGEAR